jgi:acyl-CoA dehydrogenase
MMEAARTLTCGAVDAGEKPAVLSAVVKAYLTDAMRARIADAMDVAGGAGICQGPRNVLARIYTAAPIAITVEGANILTRSLIVFGQGSIRCHPFVRAEMQAIAADDAAAFDRLLSGHAAFLFRNAARAFVLAVSGSRIAQVPGSGPVADYCRRLTRASSAFALAADAALATLGGALKRRETISGRLADALAWMYLASAALKRFPDDGRPAEDRPLLDWSCDLALWNIQEALRGVIDNLPNRPAALLLRVLIFPLGARRRPPRDRLGAGLARGLLDDGAMRRRLSRNIFSPAAGEAGLGQLENALAAVLQARAAQQKMKDAGAMAAWPPRLPPL